MIIMPENTGEKLAGDLQRAEDKAVGKLEDEFLSSVRKTDSDTDWDGIERRLATQQPAEDIADTISWKDFLPLVLLEPLFNEAAGIQAEYLSNLLKIDFKLTDPNALKWLKEYGADEIKYLSDSQRQAVKEIVTRGYADGITYQQQAREIRQLIGLDPRRAEAVQNMRAKLLSRGLLSDDKIDRQASRYAEKLLNQRARNIAVQEATTAGARAFYETTLDACKRGILDPNIYEGYRIVTGDERLCPQCSGLAGEARQLPDQAYQSSGSVTPKLHPLCRCVEGVRNIPMKKQSTKKQVQGSSNIVLDSQALKRKDGVLYVPTVPLVEGVYDQWGIRVLRSYAEFSASSHWLHGVPIVTNHEEVTPDARRIGQMFDIQNKPDSLKTSAVSRFYEIDCTQRELEALLSGKPHDGSLRWSCYLVSEPGEWVNPTTGERKQYDAKEVGPYVFMEYSLVKDGVIGTEDGAGFNMQCAGCKSHSSAPGGADMEIEEMKQAIEEAQKPLMDRLAALEQSNTTLQGELKTIKDLAATKEQAVALEKFSAKLKPGHQEKAAEYFEASQKDPLWAAENAHLFVQKGQERRLQGKASTEDGATWSMEQERARLKAEGKVI